MSARLDLRTPDESRPRSRRWRPWTLARASTVRGGFDRPPLERGPGVAQALRTGPRRSGGARRSARLSGMLLLIGELLGGAKGLDSGVRVRRGDEPRLVLVLGQDRPAHVSRAGGRSRASAAPDDAAARAARRPADAEGVHHPRLVAERVRDGPQPAARRGGGDRRHPAGAGEHELEGRHRARARARQAPRHPDQLGRGDDCRGDHDGARMAMSPRCSSAGRDDRDAAATRSRCWR